MNPIQQLIAQARLKDALDALYTAVPQHAQFEVLQLQEKFTSLERAVRIGTISFSEAGTERAKITKAALDLSIEIPANRSAGFDGPAPQARNPKPPAERDTPARPDDGFETFNPDSSEKTKILFIAANPTDASRLETDREHRLLKQQLQLGSARDRFEFLPPEFAVTITELMRAMNGKPNIVHFSGHGGAEGIYLTTENNLRQLMGNEAIKRLFKFSKGITRIVLLNACYSSGQAKIISEYGMYVVGNNLPISDPAAISFSKGFYNGLGEGKPFDEAFNDAMTVVLTENSNSASIIEVWKDGEQLDL